MKKLLDEKSEKIRFTGVGMYDWNTLTSKVKRIEKDLE